MSDFFDDENVAKSEDTNAEETQEVKVIPKKKLLPKIIAGLLCVAVLVGGTFAVIKLIPEKEEENTSSGFKTVEVLSLDGDKVSSVLVSNENGEFNFSKVTKDDTNTWTLDGIDNDLLSSDKISSVVNGAFSIEAIRKITEKTEEQCGIANSNLYAKITKDDGSVVMVTFGDNSPDNSGCYLKLSDGDIFLVEDSVKTAFVFDSLYFAAADMISAVDSDGLDDYFSDGKLTTLDTLTVSGKNYPTPLVITTNTDKSFSEYIPYKITSPQEHYADKIDGIFSVFSDGISADGAYSFDVSDTEIAKFGLNNPDLTLTIKLGSKSFSRDFKLQEDGSYAAITTGGKFIYKVSDTGITEIANADATKYYSSIICLFSIDKLDSFGITAEGKTYDFGIKKFEANKEKTEGVDSEDPYEITYGGKKIDCSSFQNLYKYVLTFGCFDFTTGETDKSSTVSLAFRFTDGDLVTVDFEKAGDTKYQYSINGRPMGKIQSSKIDKLVKYTKKLVNGEKISELN